MQSLSGKNSNVNDSHILTIESNIHSLTFTSKLNILTERYFKDDFIKHRSVCMKTISIM